MAGTHIQRIIAGILLAASALSPGFASAEVPDDLTVDRVVLIMRHGVRPPTKVPAMPAGTATEEWPQWPVNPGWLTPHGAEAVAGLGSSDARMFRKAGLLPSKGCPANGSVRVIADSDQRTIATANAWLGTLAPGCGLTAEHRRQDEPDPIFSAIETGAEGWDPSKADTAVLAAAGPGGLAARDAQERALALRLDAILCGSAKPAARPICGISARPTGLKPATATSRPKLSGLIDKASTAAQVLLLEYAEGKPMNEVGWGRATVADITALSRFHALEFALLARPKPIAAANFSTLAPIVEQGLAGPTRITMISAHDTNVANLGGLLDVHWRITGFATDDPAPGGAIVIERVHDRTGANFVRISYRAQPLERIRAGGAGAAESVETVQMRPEACSVPTHPGLCTPEQFTRLMAGK